jgi:hypothetical protein
LQPVREQHPADEPAGGDGEAALVADHERHHISRGRARHGLVGGDNPLDVVSEGRSCSWETLERVRFDITTARSWAGWKRKQRRCCGCGRTRSTKGECERKKKQMGRQSPEPTLDARFLKGAGLTPHLRRRACRVSETFAHAHACLGETTTHSRDASVPTECRLAESACSHDGAVTSVTSADMPTPITAPTSPRRP